MFIVPSVPPEPGNYINRVKTPGELTVGYEMGGVAIQDPSQGLLVQLWRVRVIAGAFIYIDAPNTPPFLLLTDVNISEVDLAFDQNMFPFVTYVSNGLIKFYWYDPLAAQFVTSTILEFAWTPRCTLDDKRPFDVSNSDIILMYVNLLSGQIVYRIQRERYATEHAIDTAAVNDQIRCVNFADNTRLQWTIDNYVQNVSPVAHNGLANYARPISVTGAYIT
jgi:hypothetical protein